MNILTKGRPEDWVIDRVIALDWYDGATLGLCRMRTPPIEFVFRLLAERYHPDGLNDRLFSVELLPSGTVEGVLQKLIPPGETVPTVWIAPWDHSKTSPGQEAVEAALASTTPSNIVLRASDFETIEGCWTVEHVREDTDWFRELDIMELPKR